jgi:hypothetical protein
VVLPVLVSDKLVGLFKQPALTITHQAVLAVLTLLLGYLGWTRADWLPGVMHNCYTLPTSTGITVLRATADGTRCYGLLDTADAGVFAATAFGRDPVTTRLERRILDANEPLEAGDLTRCPATRPGARTAVTTRPSGTSCGPCSSPSGTSRTPPTIGCTWSSPTPPRTSGTPATSPI